MAGRRPKPRTSYEGIAIENNTISTYQKSDTLEYIVSDRLKSSYHYSFAFLGGGS